MSNAAAGRGAFLAVGALFLAVPTVGQSPDTGWAAVDEGIGRLGTTQPGEVQKYSFPRSDLRVPAAGVPVKPALVLGSWVAFKRLNGKALAMGGLVLLESELAPVVSMLQAMGVEQTALHNHLRGQPPRVMYLHIHAERDPVRIAGAVRAALAEPRTPSTPPRAGDLRFELDTAGLASALKGRHNW